MKKPNRTRTKAISVRVTPEEYDEIADRIKESGLPQQTYIINAARGAVISPSKEIDALKKAGSALADISKQLRGIKNSADRIAHAADGQDVPATQALAALSDQMKSYLDENEKVWQSIRLVIAKSR